MKNMFSTIRGLLTTRNNTFTISNHLTKNLVIAMEPEGDTMDLLPGKSITVSISSNVKPAVDLQIHEDKDGIYVAIWPEDGDYEITG